jgi:hypothetical protein
MSQSGRNTNIPVRQYGCRLPSETPDGIDDGYAASSKVDHYYLSPEELEKYKQAPKPEQDKPKHKEFKISKKYLIEQLQKFSAAQVAFKVNMQEGLLKQIIARYGLELDEHGRLVQEVEDVGRQGIEISKSELQGYIAKGMKRTAIARKFGCSKSVVDRAMSKHGLSTNKFAREDKVMQDFNIALQGDHDKEQVVPTQMSAPVEEAPEQAKETMSGLEALDWINVLNIEIDSYSREINDLSEKRYAAIDKKNIISDALSKIKIEL